MSGTELMLNKYLLSKWINKIQAFEEGMFLFYVLKKLLGHLMLKEL